MCCSGFESISYGVYCLARHQLRVLQPSCKHVEYYFVVIFTMLTSAFSLSIFASTGHAIAGPARLSVAHHLQALSRKHTPSRLQLIHNAKCTSRLITLQLAKCAKCLVCRNSRAGQAAMQSPGMSRGSPESNALQHAVTSSQPEISSPPAQVSSTHHYSA